MDAAEVEGNRGSSAAALGGGVSERRSKRARKLRQPLQLSSTTTLQELKLRLFEVFNVHPKNARVYTRGSVLLECDDLSLAQLEVFPEDEVRALVCVHVLVLRMCVYWPVQVGEGLWAVHLCACVVVIAYVCLRVDVEDGVRVGEKCGEQPMCQGRARLGEGWEDALVGRGEKEGGGRAAGGGYTEQGSTMGLQRGTTRTMTNNQIRRNNHLRFIGRVQYDGDAEWDQPDAKQSTYGELHLVGPPLMPPSVQSSVRRHTGVPASWFVSDAPFHTKAHRGLSWLVCL